MSTVFELFGYRRDAWNPEAQANLRRAWCPFMGAECDGGGNRQQSAIDLTTNLKLAPYFPDRERVQAGVCSLLINGSEQPWIVCPRRLLSMRQGGSTHQDYVLKSLIEKVQLPCGSYKVWSEVKMKVETSTEDDEDKYFDYTFDYIIASHCARKLSDVAEIVGLSVPKAKREAEKNGYTLAARNGELWVEDFPADPVVIIEIMTSSTSGGNKKNRTQIAMAFEDAIVNEDHIGPGINYRQVWARMVSQLIVKSQVALAWGGKTVWLIQDVLADYVSSSTALNLANYVSQRPDEVNILAFSYSKLHPAQPITPLAASKFYAGPITNAPYQSGFVDIVKIGAPPHKGHLWRSLFRKKHISALNVPVK